MLAPEPFLTSVVLAGGLVAAAGSDEQKAELLGALSRGRDRAGLRARRARLALAADARRRSRRPASDDSWTLSGVKEPVPHGARADVLVVSAALPDGGTGLFVVDADAAGADPRRLPHPRRRPRRAA